MHLSFTPRLRVVAKGNLPRSGVNVATGVQVRVKLPLVLVCVGSLLVRLSEFLASRIDPSNAPSPTRAVKLGTYRAAGVL